MKLILAAIFGLVIGHCDQESRLVDKLVKVQRQVERAEARSQVSGQKLIDFCKSKGKTFQIKRNGLMGCVAIQSPAPPTAPGK